MKIKECRDAACCVSTLDRPALCSITVRKKLLNAGKKQSSGNGCPALN